MPSYPADDKHIKIPAGWLIEQSGWKGKVIGAAGVHKDQALVIVNLGDASGKEIITLSEKIVASIKENFNITLEKEVIVI